MREFLKIVTLKKDEDRNYLSPCCLWTSCFIQLKLKLKFGRENMEEHNLHQECRLECAVECAVVHAEECLSNSEEHCSVTKQGYTGKYRRQNTDSTILEELEETSV